MPEKFRPERDSNPDVCDAGAMPMPIWELAVMWVYDRPADGGQLPVGLIAQLVDQLHQHRRGHGLSAVQA